MIKGSQEQSHHGSVDAFERRLRRRPSADALPKRQGSNDQKKGGQKHGDKADDRSAPAADNRTKISCKGEQWTWNCLCRSVAGEKRIAGEPASWHDLRLQERQHDVTTAEHQGTRAVKRIEKLQGPVTGSHACSEGQAD